ncbi:MAG: EamA family transporter, partial [Bacteroidia bacterium]
MFKGINKHHLLLHFIVLIWGFSPVLGRFISTSALQLVWFRIAFTLIIITGYILIIKKNVRTSWPDLLRLAGIGVIIAVHWLCF